MYEENKQSGGKILKIAVCGMKGRMGRAVIAEIQKAELSFAGGADIGTSPEYFAALLGDADAVIDFSCKDATAAYARQCAEAGVPFLSGVTGLSDSQHDELRETGKKIPVLWSPNMSVAVNLSMAVCAYLSKKLTDFDIHIHETHHSAKKDSPSGTAINYAKAINKACGKMPPMTSARIGGETGTHSVYFGGAYETLEITHRAGNRSLFAAGAVSAAKWLALQKPGFYCFNDFLGIGTEIF